MNEAVVIPERDGTGYQHLTDTAPVVTRGDEGVRALAPGLMGGFSKLAPAAPVPRRCDAEN